ncbi:dephospho-CoA kinase [Aquibacillus halophilus]|uniref:Dephospho-CoA kinase n=1 Tax=Aquibacillus halophilus TaxID=930132 RepID=A0A6A8DNR7_9BACI|nr:dephospho-CoA kinase [Aquibacillus halophilus]MRH42892.1 dephospho-CoA kinase [Aquibacillus halophilus]
MTITIGLTGSIASGKSTIAKMIIEEGIPVIDADIIARQVVEPGAKAYHEIIEAFGQEILNAEKEIDRKKLGNIVFSDKSKLKELNSIVHPAVREKMLKQRDEWINKDEKAVILDIPLLFESKLTNLVNKVLVVYVDELTQLQRLKARDKFSEQEALDRIHSQISMKEKASMADAVIDNNGTKEESKKQLKAVLTKWGIPI